MVSELNSKKTITDFFIKMQNKFIHVVTTNDCFFNCSHCMVHKNKEELTMDKIKDIISFAKKYHYNINWGGGEILKRGKSFLKQIVKYFDDSISNTIYTTLHIRLDDEYIQCLNKFDEIMVSIDSYRLALPEYNIKLVLDNVKRLSIPKKTVSYTPAENDSFKEYETYYLMAMDIGVDVFHIGFLYPSANKKLISPSKYLEILEAFYSLDEKYNKRIVAYFKDVSLKPTDNFGFRAYDCFRGGIYLSADGKVSSCMIGEITAKRIGIPFTSFNDFMQNPTNFFELNLKFIKKEFLSIQNNECLVCEYYTYCMGGCPYFRSFSGGGKDIYCSVYKKIFELYINKGGDFGN